MQDQAKNTSLRTAFIRVTSENNTENGKCMYKEDDILGVLSDWSKSAKLKYWFIKHENDNADEDKRTHFHIVIKFNSPTAFSVIKNKFPYGQIAPARNIRDCVQYLIHANDPTKRQYNSEDIFSNAKTDIPKLLDKKSKRKKDIDDYIEAISKGDIREFNQFTKIPPEVWVKYRTRIENAFCYYREKTYLDKNREISTVFIFGASGTGKTTYVKDYCNANKLSLCVSSSSNDPFQDYKGEDVLLLDDLRDRAFEYEDLLKILDCHTRSTSKSRYHNKFFTGKIIFITSTLSIDFWYPVITRESRTQFYRRIKYYWMFYLDTIKLFEYNDRAMKYTEAGEILNPVRNKFTKTESKNIFQNMKIQYADKVSEQVAVFYK